MKTKCLFFGMLIMMSLATSALANDGREMTVVTAKDSEVIKVIYKGNTSAKVKLNIFNEQGNIIHSASIAAKDGFICPLNFKGLPSGNYTIELVDDQGSRQENVTYVALHDRKSVHVSKIINEDGKFLFAVANAQNESIIIRIYDQRQKLVYSGSKVIAGDFAQVFRMPSGLDRYTFVVSDVVGNQKSFIF